MPALRGDLDPRERRATAGREAGMKLSLIDRVLIVRAEEAMRAFTKASFEEVQIAGRVGRYACCVPGCDRKVRILGGPCKKHWRLRHKGRKRMSDPLGTVRR
jgi:hypothetical protein